MHWNNEIMITIKHLQKNQFTALNNPQRVDMSLKLNQTFTIIIEIIDMIVF